MNAWIIVLMINAYSNSLTVLPDHYSSYKNCTTALERVIDSTNWTGYERSPADEVGHRLYGICIPVEGETNND